MSKNTLVFPEFIIAGAQKCGSSSLAVWLDSHPELICSIPKEPKYFTSQKTCNDNRGFESFFKNADTVEKAKLFEASQIYMIDPAVPLRIREICGPDMKFIFIVKDPIARATSAYFHTFKHGTDLRSQKEVFTFPTSDADEIEKIERERTKRAIQAGHVILSRYEDYYDDPILPFLYVSNSMYRKHIKRFADVFGEDQILVVSLSALKADPKSTFHKICKFLNVSDFQTLPNVDEKHNATQIPRYMTFSLIRKNSKLIKLAKRLTKIGQRLKLEPFLYVGSLPVQESVKDNLTRILQNEKTWVATL